MKSLTALFVSAILFVLAGAQANAQIVRVATRNLKYANELTTAGVVPVQTVEVADAKFALSKPLKLDDSHQIAVAWIRLAKEQAIRVLYRSNSQCSWRLCDATTPNHIGKGFHEFDKQVPIAVTLAVLRSHADTGTLKPWFPTTNEGISQELLAQKILRLLTSDRDVGVKNGVVLVMEGRYLTNRVLSGLLRSVFMALAQTGHGAGQIKPR